MMYNLQEHSIHWIDNTELNGIHFTFTSSMSQKSLTWKWRNNNEIIQQIMGDMCLLELWNEIIIAYQI